MRDIRNVAIIAHVDHGKTTVVDGLLQQAGTWADHETHKDRVMDSMDLERERGITILSKCTAVDFKGTRINIVDTPGHADFGGEVERILGMVDAALLLVDASEGPLPQTRFVLQKAFAEGLRIIVCINKIDRPDERIEEVVDEVYDLFIDLGADDEQINFPILYACAKDGTCGHTPEEQTDLRPLFDALVKHTPPPIGDPKAELQVLITQLDHDPYVGRLAIGRVYNGTIRERDEIALIGEDNKIRKVKVNLLYIHQGLKRVQVKEVEAGEIIAIAGINDLTIGDTLTSLTKPKVLPRVRVDEPTIGIMFTNNDGPMSGLDGKYVTARKIRERLEKEMLHNVALKMEDTDRSDTMRVFGRGELQLCILIEQMRRQGYELCVSKPEVVLKEQPDGTVHEPFEIAVLDFPVGYMGVVNQKMAFRKAQMQEMKRDGSDRVRLVFRIPTRGLIGFRGEYLNDTRGEGLIHTLFDGYDVEAGYMRYRMTGSLVADRAGKATPYALYHLQPRGRLFIRPVTDVYEGMIVGENARGNDMNVNITRAKQLTNIRSAGADEKLVLSPPIQTTLESGLEFLADDELMEVTPFNLRLRKKVLKANMRSIVKSRRRVKP